MSGPAPRILDGVTVLLVDDEDDGREMIALVLTEGGATVIEAKSSAEALAEFSKRAPDVIVSDIGLPMEDGFELLRRVRELEATTGGKVPAIALSGYEHANSGQSSDDDFAAHLTKPIGVQVLLRAIAELLPRR